MYCSTIYLKHLKSLLSSRRQKRNRSARKMNLFTPMAELWNYDSRNLCSKKGLFFEQLYGPPCVMAALLKLKCRKLGHCKNLVIHSSSGVSSGSTSSDTASNEDKNAPHGPHSPTPSSSSSQGTVKRAGPNSAANSVISNNVNNNKSSENNSAKSSGGQLVRPRHLKQRKEVFKVVFLQHTTIIHIFHLVSLF